MEKSWNFTNKFFNAHESVLLYDTFSKSNWCVCWFTGYGILWCGHGKVMEFCRHNFVATLYYVGVKFSEKPTIYDVYKGHVIKHVWHILRTFHTHWALHLKSYIKFHRPVHCGILFDTLRGKDMKSKNIVRSADGLHNEICILRQVNKTFIYFSDRMDKSSAVWGDLDEFIRSFKSSSHWRRGCATQCRGTCYIYWYSRFTPPPPSGI